MKTSSLKLENLSSFMEKRNEVFFQYYGGLKESEKNDSSQSKDTSDDNDSSQMGDHSSTNDSSEIIDSSNFGDTSVS